jgi:hypothetical protein
MNKLLIANRSDKPQSGAAAKLNWQMHEVHAGDFTPMETRHA